MSNNEIISVANNTLGKLYIKEFHLIEYDRILFRY